MSIVAQSPLFVCAMLLRSYALPTTKALPWPLDRLGIANLDASDSLLLRFLRSGVLQPGSCDFPKFLTDFSDQFRKIIMGYNGYWL